MVVVDRLTKYAHFSALSHDFNASKVAEFFIQDVVKLHGLPRLSFLIEKKVHI